MNKEKKKYYNLINILYKIIKTIFKILKQLLKRFKCIKN